MKNLSSGREPDIHDDFSGTNTGWSFYSALVESGVLRLPKGGRADHPYFDGKPNFVFQVDAFPPTACCAYVRIGSTAFILVLPIGEFADQIGPTVLESIMIQKIIISL